MEIDRFPSEPLPIVPGHGHDHAVRIPARPGIDLKIRTLTDEQIHRFEGYAAEMLEALGMDTGTPSTIDTPRRFVRA
ncbi:MAG TPA: hypothetical protein PK819_13135, partial [Thermomicrobiales bacterium]|nr:hypothetical protein [Thermomicrobiales bacterium]